MSALGAQGLSKTFGSHRALDSVSLCVQTAERFVILGPSGAGKTTLLRGLCGLERLDEGQVTIAGVDVTSVAPYRRPLGLVFQQGALFAHLTVFENLAFPLRVAGARTRDIRDRVEEVARVLGVQTLLQRSTSLLAGGERQRVAIARALLREPQALLLDEPLAHLDPSARTSVREAVLAVGRSQGRAVVLVTHDHEEALGMADRLGILIAGRIIQCDVPFRVYDSPANTEVARFLGPLPMNVLPGAGERFGIGAVTVGIRPQDVAVNNGATSLEGIVVACEFSGIGWLAQVETDAGIVCVRIAQQQRPLVGERLRLHFPEDKVRRFDSATGSAIS